MPNVNYCYTDCGERVDTKKKQQCQCNYSHLPEFIVEGPEEVQVETTEVQQIFLLEVGGILQRWRIN